MLTRRTFLAAAPILALRLGPHDLGVKSTIEQRTAEWTACYLSLNDPNERIRFYHNRLVVHILLLGSDTDPRFERANMTLVFHRTLGGKISVMRLSEGKWAECQLVE